MDSPQAPAESFSTCFASLGGGRATAAAIGDSADGPEPRLPGWLAQVAEFLFDGLEPSEARAWAERLYQELARLDGVPFRVVHDWHAGTTGPLTAATSERHGGSAAAHRAVQALHTRALAGERSSESTWCAALEPVLREVYRHAYADAEAYAAASAAARSFALSRDYGEVEATEYGETYAVMNTEANARAHADANALAVSAAAAAAFAAADAEAYADTYPFAQVQACVLGHAGPDTTRQRDACTLLADGLADSLARAGRDT